MKEIGKKIVITKDNRAENFFNLYLTTSAGIRNLIKERGEDFANFLFSMFGQMIFVSKQTIKEGSLKEDSNYEIINQLDDEHQLCVKIMPKRIPCMVLARLSTEEDLEKGNLPIATYDKDSFFFDLSNINSEVSKKFAKSEAPYDISTFIAEVRLNLTGFFRLEDFDFDDFTQLDDEAYLKIIKDPRFKKPVAVILHSKLWRLDVGYADELGKETTEEIEDSKDDNAEFILKAEC